jgi:hypothetical protein
MDILRTLAHELTHYRQHERLGKKMPDDAGRTGSPYENEANAEAGIIMRHFQNRYPEFFASTVSEDGDSVDETIVTPVSKDEKANQDYYKFVRGKQQLGRPLTKAEMQFLSKYQLTQHLKKQVAEQDLEEGIGKALGTAAVAGAMALGSPAAKSQDAGRVAYQIGKQIYQPSGIFTRAGAEEEIKGMARDLARGQEIRVGGKRIFGSPQAQGERVAANGIGATPEQAFQDALTRAYEDANRRYGPISIGDWRPVNNEKEIQRVGGQYQAAVVIQGPAPVREGASGYIPTK